jgi:hypothetical protein
VRLSSCEWLCVYAHWCGLVMRDMDMHDEGSVVLRQLWTLKYTQPY